MSNTASGGNKVIVVASVDRCLGSCDRCVGFYEDFTGKFRVGSLCKCEHRRHKERELTEEIQKKWNENEKIELRRL